MCLRHLAFILSPHSDLRCTANGAGAHVVQSNNAEQLVDRKSTFLRGSVSSLAQQTLPRGPKHHYAHLASTVVAVRVSLPSGLLLMFNLLTTPKTYFVTLALRHFNRYFTL